MGAKQAGVINSEFFMHFNSQKNYQSQNGKKHS
jgi:hypothetical protein